ncbi:MAG: NAD(P)/FAD-dependent oxidoreductase [Acidimicrobiaceae bacterium]|nr:NAD(P)/FAD-dependent oxidoreductase [Acidimicrobiaceae bacterium]MDE0516531.1 NAD(P)/FAD-dependent oxidoreductase [Acidimicrobiaceae bacterium]MXZ94570.1 NAD(P)/FAD-dependent oxidoreductase [Acidimicrobiaceae bacterium]MYF44253.1 NAD(P)/FAD-dependent oxidoreductase [Acidimicrobiaceae bacterium]MYJ37137.1 NAD(P)/FAD-dependent oxidoreductase [Acidimicrobiaceae bacterium]
MDAEQIEQLLEAADLPSLLAALAHATGDPGLAPTDLWLNPDLALQPDGGWDEQQTEKARVLASSGLQRLMSPRTGADGPADDLVPFLIDWLTGADLDDGYRRMLAEELAVTGDLRVPEPIRGDGWPPTDADYPVAVIGAGMSGILAAHRLKQAGVDCVVLEKNPDVGGTWLENTYPGCRVDVFNHVYSYAGEQRPDWPQYHSSQPVLLDYFQDCARRWGIRDRMRFGTGVDAMSWDEHARCWTLQLDSGESVTAGAVVSAVGQLNRPLMPDIEGIGSFAGEKFHSSSWRHDIDWDGLRVAVIGTGASALQFIPHLATDAAHVTVFQRTPPWLIPRPVYHEPLAEGLLELFRLIPGYAHWFRLRLFWCTHEGTVGALRRDPAWDGPLDQAVSRRNEETRRLLTLYLRSQFGDRPDLLEKVVPDYPVGSKRVVLDNGIWASTLKRPNVELVSDGIERVEPAGVRGADGRLHRADVIVFGTGFRASEFLMPMRVAGRGGADLHETWNGDARAYNGVCVPGFPNLFCLYGPNTNIVVNGSIIYFAECATHYVVECLRLLASQGAAAMDCRSDAYDRYAARMDEHNSQMAWGISPVNSWYKSPSGRIAQNWPLPLIDYWRQTRAPSPADFELI